MGQRRGQPHSQSMLGSMILIISFLVIFMANWPHASWAAGPGVSGPVKYDISPKLWTLKPLPVSYKAGQAREIPRGNLPRASAATEAGLTKTDTVVQNWQGNAPMPGPAQNFEGIGNISGLAPPDTQGDVGPNHYIQWVNISFAIYDKTGTVLYGPAAGNTLWSGFGGPCQTTNDGDPITLYDHLADRWVMSQFALPNYPNGPFYQCIAVSQTGDPLGSWYRYQYSFDKMNDYPKFGVWPDGYYMTINQFASGSGSWAGAGAVAFEREKMLSGQAAQMVYFDLYDADPVNFGGILPADLDGPAPPAGTPNYFAQFNDQPDQLWIWEFHVDWTTPANSVFGTATHQPNLKLDTEAFNAALCSYSRNCIPQPGTTQKLDAISDRLMYRLQYRNMAGFQAMVTNHTVNVSGSGDQAGIRWYELRKTTGDWGIHQQGTYAPDTDHRWMGSIAMDSVGNIALGYSVSSGTVYPSIRYVGRLAGDPLGTLTQTETELVAGNNVQSGVNRWGDYSMMAVDPGDNCTFWYTQEYFSGASGWAWKTRIGSFKFANCTTEGGTLQGKVTASGGGNPIPGATVAAGVFSTLTNDSGDYTLSVPAGTYDMTVTKIGYQAASAIGVSVLGGGTTAQNFSLTSLPLALLKGKVTDGSGAGWPLYAEITATANGASATTFTNPVTGQYIIQLYQSTAYTVEAASTGYTSKQSSVTLGASGVTRDFSLSVDALTCSAPGYSMSSGSCAALPGGLITGYVYDKNTKAPLSLVTMTTATGNVTQTTTTDVSGLYLLFSPAGSHKLTATPPSSGYGTLTQSVGVTKSKTVRKDFYLPAANLGVSQSAFSVMANTTASRTFKISASGTRTTTFSILKLTEVPQPLGPFQKPDYTMKPFKQGFGTAAGLPIPPPPAAAPYAAGDAVRSWDTGLPTAWGISYNGKAGTVWVSSPAANWGGNDTAMEYSVTGSPTGRSWPHAVSHSNGPADMAYDPVSGNMWIMYVGSEGAGNCIREIDPAKGYTGKSVCPGGTGFAVSQRGLAYDPSTDTFFAGGWNDSNIHHFNSSGTMLSSVNVGLAVSGLAYNPDTKHLFAMTNGSPNSVYVLDAADSYNLLGSFTIAGF